MKLALQGVVLAGYVAACCAVVVLALVAVVYVGGRLGADGHAPSTHPATPNEIHWCEDGQCR